MSFFYSFSPFSLCAEVSEENTATVATIASIILSVCLVLLVAVLIRRKTLKSADIVYGGVATALAFVLSFLKITPVLYGGSITLASMLPIILYAYFFGFAKGLAVGIAYGLLQFIQSPYILTPMTFVLDYMLAFASIAAAALPRKFIKNECGALCLAVLFVYFFRFIFHLISGIIYFKEGAVWADLPAENALVYSLIYQLVYLAPDFLICLCAAFALYKLKVVERIAPRAFK